MKHPQRLAVLTLVATLLPLAAQAHPGHETHAGLLQGLMHPLTGWDHLFVLLSLGVLAAGRGPRLALAAGATLVAALLGGAMLGLAWSAPFVEPVLLATVIACAVLMVLRRHVSGSGLLSLCLAFTFVHGLAHGQEAPAGDVGGYFAGFVLTGAAIYGAGLLLAQQWLRRLAPSRAKAGI